MELGISTGIFYQDDLLSNLAAIHKAGFRHVELCIGQKKGDKVVHYDWRDALYTDKLRSEVQRLGLNVATMHAPYSPEIDLAHPDPARRLATLEELCGVGRVLKSFGGRTLVVHVAVNEFNLGDRAEKERRLDYVRRLLGPMVEVLRPLGIRLALENLLPHLLGGEVAVLNDLLKPFSADDVGLCFDTSHANLWGGTAVYDMLDQSLPRLASTHLSDNKGQFDDHFMPGEGVIDWTKIGDRLRRAKYDGVVLLEVFRSANGTPAAQVLADSFKRGQELLKI